MIFVFLPGCGTHDWAGPRVVDVTIKDRVSQPNFPPQEIGLAVHL